MCDDECRICSTLPMMVPRTDINNQSPLFPVEPRCPAESFTTHLLEATPRPLRGLPNPRLGNVRLILISRLLLPGLGPSLHFLVFFSPRGRGHSWSLARPCQHSPAVGRAPPSHLGASALCLVLPATGATPFEHQPHLRCAASMQSQRRGEPVPSLQGAEGNPQETFPLLLWF